MNEEYEEAEQRNENAENEQGDMSYIDLAGEDFAETDAPEESVTVESAERKNPQEDYQGNFTVKHRKHCKHKVLKLILAALLAGVVFGAAFGFANVLITKYSYSNVSIGKTELNISKGKAAESDVAAITQACMPSVVAITNRGVSDVMTFFGTYSQESTSSGSGIIIGKNDTELLIVTNYHVVANSKELSVIFTCNETAGLMNGSTESEYMPEDKAIPNAIIKGYDSNKDLAVIAVAIKDIMPSILEQIKIATIGNSSAIKQGDKVVAIGNALGYGQSVTAGVVSAVNRKITMQNADGSAAVSNNFIQTDAAINFGNSGGALLNTNGEVIGINSAKISANGVEGMGYAIPVSDVANIIKELMEKKTREKVSEDKQGFLGITGTTIAAETSEAYGIPVGVLVRSVTKNLAADEAGIKKGSVITKFDGYTVNTIEQLQERLTYYKAGEKVKVEIMVPAAGSNYKSQNLTVKLSNKAENIDKVK